MFGPRIRTRPTQTAIILLLLWFGAAPTAHAQFYVWNTPNTGNWTDSLNWSGGVIPSSAPATELAFVATGTASYTATNDIANPFLLKRLVLDNAGSGTITINGSAITFANTDSTIENFNSGPVTVATPINLAANAFFQGASTGTVTLSGTLNDGGSGFGVTTGGAGTYAFTGTGASSINFLRVMSGTTQINAGSWSLTNTTTADNTAALIVGRVSGQTANFNLSGGATLTVAGGNVLFAEVDGSGGVGTITGSGTTLTASGTNSGLFVVGNRGTASVTISGGAVVNSRLGLIGRNAGSNGTVIVDGAGSQWTNTGTLTVGSSGTGSLTVQGGGKVSPGSLIVAGSSGAAGTVTVTGAGSELVTTGSGGITTQLGGTLTVSAGGLVSGHDVNIGFVGTTTTAIVDASTLTVRNLLLVGQAGTGGLTIRNGSLATVAGNGFVGQTSVGAGPSLGTLTVTGANSRFTVSTSTSFLVFGSGSGTARGDLIVQNGGTVTSSGTQLTFAQDSTSSSVSLVDAGTVTATGTLSLGQSGTASLTVQNGGTVTAANVVMGANSGSSGTLTVTGAGSSVSTAGVLRLAGLSNGTAGGTATVNVASGGSITAGGRLVLFGGGAANVNGAALAVGGVTHGNPTSIGNINLSSGGTLTITNGLGSSYAGVISGVGGVVKNGAGTQTFSGANTYTTGTTINGGTLLVTNTTGSGTGNGGTTVNGGGTLGGTGRVAPALSVQPVVVTLNGGTVQAGGTDTAAPTRTDVLTITQGLTFDGAATLRSTVGQSGGVGAAGQVDLNTGAGQLRRNTSGAGADVMTIRLTNDGTLDLSGNTTYTVTVLTYFTLDAGSLTEFINQSNPTHFAAAAENFQFAATPLISLSGGNLSISFVPVPEPASVLAVAAAAGFTATWLRRRIGRTPTNPAV